MQSACVSECTCVLGGSACSCASEHPPRSDGSRQQRQQRRQCRRPGRHRIGGAYATAAAAERRHRQLGRSRRRSGCQQLGRRQRWRRNAKAEAGGGDEEAAVFHARVQCDTDTGRVGGGRQSTDAES